MPEAVPETVHEMGRDLSHPEQVKRWAVLRNDLSMERGDLTANLKLKRQVVAARSDGLIDALYAESFAADEAANWATAACMPAKRCRARWETCPS